MNEARRRIIQAINDARTCEQTHVDVLQAQIAVAPRGRYRKGLQAHLRETRDHARRLEKRLGELGQRDNVVQFGIRLVENALAQGLALGRAPLGLLRGSGGPESVLNNAKQACATEAFGIATYTAIEGLAKSSGDGQTARLAASIRADEQKMLDHLLDEIPSLLTWVVDAEARGKASSAIPQNGAGAPAASPGRKRRKPASRTSTGTKRRVRRARKAPRVAQARGRRAIAADSELPIRNYETLTVGEVVTRLAALSQIELAKVAAYERKHESRPPILNRIADLRSGPASTRSHELRVDEIGTVLKEGDEDRAASVVRSYGGPHENRDSVLEATDQELTGT